MYATFAAQKRLESIILKVQSSEYKSVTEMVSEHIEKEDPFNTKNK